MPLILAIETSGPRGSVALWDDAARAPLAEVDLGEARGHGSALVPGMSEALFRAGRRPEDVDRVAVSIGPGSFTGVRIGAAAAKAFAWARGIPIAPVPTLLALAVDAAEMRPEADLLVPVMDAHSKGLVHTAAFRRADRSAPPAGEAAICGLVRVMPDESRLPDGLGNEPFLAGALFFGDAAPGLPVHLNRMPAPVTPKATTIARLATELPAADSVHAVAPLYLRPSAAEQQWEARRRG
jgi:tRNA threonylcarbamoyl adenosine modification protein YeaZ